MCKFYSECCRLSHAAILSSDYDLFDENRYGTLHGHVDDLLAIIDELCKQQKVGLCSDMLLLAQRASLRKQECCELMEPLLFQRVENK